MTSTKLLEHDAISYLDFQTVEHLFAPKAPQWIYVGMIMFSHQLAHSVCLFCFFLFVCFTLRTHCKCEIGLSSLKDDHSQASLLSTGVQNALWGLEFTKHRPPIGDPSPSFTPQIVMPDLGWSLLYVSGCIYKDHIPWNHRHSMIIIWITCSQILDIVSSLGS